MAQPYVGEIRMFAGNFAPAGWMLCEGQLLPISEYETLFNLIGTTYGGDGQSTYALPDLRGRVPVHQGQGPGLAPWTIGQTGGAETVSLTEATTPTHRHVMQASTHAGSTNAGPADVIGAPPSTNIWGTGTPDQLLADAAVGNQTGGMPHDNMGPSLGLNFIISLYGIFPSQS